MQRIERVLILVLDGLRPDLVTPDTMPFLSSLERQGLRLTHYTAAYPPHTRVQVTTMCTGTYPSQHGIVSNVMVLDGLPEDGVLDTSDFRQLKMLDELTDGQAVLRAPLADLLAEQGKRFAIAATGSTGSTWLWARTQPYRVVNPRSTFGIPDLASLREKLGEPPEPDAPSLDLARYALTAVRDLFLPDPEIAVTVLWLNEPDATFHFAGLGSTESLNIQRALDTLLEGFFDDLVTRGFLDHLLVFLLSDHGQSTPHRHRSLRELLREAPPTPALKNLVPAADFLFRLPGTSLPRPQELQRLTEWLLDQSWVGAVLAHPELAPDLPGTLDLSLVWGGRFEPFAFRRLPVIAVSPAWDSKPNAYGIPGSVAALTEQVALRSTHGAGSPFDLRAYALLFGPGIRAGESSAIPAGVIDIAPTIAAALGFPSSSAFSGRILHEAFDTRWQPTLQHQTIRSQFDRCLRGMQVGSTFYLDEISGTQVHECE